MSDTTRDACMAGYDAGINRMGPEGAILIKFGHKLREIRYKKDWNQEKLATEMGITQASISQFETGTRQPTPALARKFADVLGVELVELGGEDGSGVLDLQRLMRNLKGLSPNSLETINTIVEAIRQKELQKRQGNKRRVPRNSRRSRKSTSTASWMTIGPESRR